jgi:hypothetical protein
MKNHYFKRAITVFAVLLSSLTALSQGFSGPFAIPNWTLSAPVGGSVNTAAAPASISLVGGSLSLAGNTDYSTTYSGTCPIAISFDWSVSHPDCTYDNIYYGINGVFTFLTDCNGSGSVGPLTLNPGETLTFRVNTEDGFFGAPTLTVSNLQTTGFGGNYDPANWITTNTNSNGSVNTASAPCSITLNGSNNGSFTSGTIDYATTFATCSVVSFSYNVSHPDCGPYDYIQYGINGVFTTITSCNASGNVGPLSIPTGGTLTFRILSMDNTGGAPTATFSNFVVVGVVDVIAPVPTVATLADVTAECQVTTLTAPTATDNCSATVTVTNNAILPITTQGTTVVTWTYDDGNGNTSTQTQNVVIDDVTAPTPDAATLADVTAECEITSLTAPTATDNCSATVTVTNNAVFPIITQGTTVVTWTYNDGNGNLSTQTQNVVIDDVTAPVITCQGDVVVSNDAGICGAVVTYSTPTVTDNCSGMSTNLILNGSAESGFANWNITQSGGDGWAISGATYEGTSSFIGSYSMSVKEQIVDLVANGFTASQLDAAPSIEVSEWYKASGCCSPNDEYFFSADLLDGSMNVIANYSVGSQFSPVLSGAAWTQTSNVFTAYGAGVRYVRITHGSRDNEFWGGHYGTEIDATSVKVQTTPSLVQIAGLSSGSEFPVGSTTNTYQATDANGNVSTCSFVVTVNDTEVPVISCPTNIVISNDAGLCGAVVSFATPTATDNCGGALPNILFVSDNGDATEIPAALIAEGYSVTTVLNDYAGGDNATLQGSLSAYDLIYWHASGASGYGEEHNLATITNLNAFVAAGGNVFVTGYDVIVSPTDLNLITFLGGTYGDDTGPGYNTLVGPNSLTDGYSNIVGMTINAPNGDQDNLNGLLPGTTMVLQGSSGSGAEWSLYSIGGGEIAWVSSGQISASTFSDWTTPGTGYHETLLNFAYNTSSASVAVAQTDLSGLISGDVFPVGTTTIEYTATDASGNSSICSFTVTVNDTEAPVADLVTLADVTAECEVTSLTAPTATDNCATMVTVSNDATFPITSDVTVTWTYDDGNGNTSTQTQMVIIDDVTGPIADLATLVDVTATCEVTSLTAPTATDNCSSMVTVSNNAIFPITSDVTVTWTYDDGNGNTTTQAQNVIIEAVDATVSVSAATITANNSNGGVTYQWVDCDNANAPIAGATGISFTATVSGNYAVEVTEGNCIELSNCTVIDLSSIGELSANLLNVYPNPASSVMNIETSVEGTVNIFDLSGKLIYTQNAFAGKNELNVNQLATGSYTLRLTTAKGTQVVRFVINRQ